MEGINPKKIKNPTDPIMEYTTNDLIESRTKLQDRNYERLLQVTTDEHLLKLTKKGAKELVDLESEEDSYHRLGRISTLKPKFGASRIYSKNNQQWHYGPVNFQYEKSYQYMKLEWNIYTENFDLFVWNENFSKARKPFRHTMWTIYKKGENNIKKNLKIYYS